MISERVEVTKKHNLFYDKEKIQGRELAIVVDAETFQTVAILEENNAGEIIAKVKDENLRLQIKDNKILIF